ncbi:hypothetical protein JTB14_022455 [Gonioctena quinquepunctata]|nr:hypothetical protein JTB14_022455 [Gonioctena quinquepunctata]
MFTCQKCQLSSIESKENHNIGKRSLLQSTPKQTQWLFNLTGDTIDIDGDEGDIEFKHGFEEENDPDPDTNEEDESITAGNQSTAGNSVQFHVGGLHQEQFGDDEDGYFYDTAWSTNVLQG